MKNSLKCLKTLEKVLHSKKTILTHMGSELKFNELVEYLPKGIEPGYDGLILNI